MSDTETCFGCRKSNDKIGVLLAQLGTPDAPTTKALRRYLAQFLSDRRVVEVNRVLWWFILNGIILRTRPARSAALYKRVWTKDGSPLLDITKRQAEGLRQLLIGRYAGVEVAFGMRYGNPSLESAVDELVGKGCTKILLFPMYPQYAAATTASTYDAVFPHLLKMRFVPTLSVAEPYYKHPGYIAAVAAGINKSLESTESQPERLILSYHGIPRAYVEKGDPYCCMCHETTAALKKLIKFPADKILHTYQSRFGKEPWIEPYTDETVKSLAEQGIKRLMIACPGFTADCLETIDEMGHEAFELFREHGGELITLVPCVNDDQLWLEGMAEIVEDELYSWLQTRKRQQRDTDRITCSWR
ncbi:MAG: ferrochelatase [bacterium]|nr:ferrochelatase [bacterium]